MLCCLKTVSSSSLFTYIFVDFILFQFGVQSMWLHAEYVWVFTSLAWLYRRQSAHWICSCGNWNIWLWCNARFENIFNHMINIFKTFHGLYIGNSCMKQMVQRPKLSWLFVITRNDGGTVSINSFQKLLWKQILGDSIQGYITFYIIGHDA